MLLDVMNFEKAKIFDNINVFHLGWHGTPENHATPATGYEFSHPAVTLKSTSHGRHSRTRNSILNGRNKIDILPEIGYH